MKIRFLSAFVLILLSTFARAQSGNKIAISFGPELSIPFHTENYNYGNIKDNYKDGIGGSFKIELPITLELHFTGSAGYVNYQSNRHYFTPNYDPFPGPIGTYIPNNGALAPPYKFIPIKAGLQYYFVKYLCIDGEAGAAIKATSQSINSLIYSGGLGGDIPFSPHQGLDIGILYERGFKTIDYDSPMSQLNIRLAYKYTF